MPDHDWLRIADLSRKLGIRLILDVFGDTSLQLALLLKVNSVMLHATDVTNIPLLTLVSDAHFDHVYVGVGGSTMGEINKLTVMKANRIIVMTGFQAYPTEDDELNLIKIKILKNFVTQNYNNVEVGFGDHRFQSH